MMARKYPNLPKYVLETDYGCYSDYGWTVACTSYDFSDAKEKYEHWVKTSGNYRLIDGETGDILIPKNE